MNSEEIIDITTHGRVGVRSSALVKLCSSVIDSSAQLQQ